MTPFITVPTWEAGQWTTTDFTTRKDFGAFLDSCFKEPGLYQFDETSYLFNEQARAFQANKLYCTAPFKTKDYISYWNEQKNLCRNGAIFKNKGKTWYLTRDYYMWLNFLPIYDKEEKRFDFAKVRDAQYHMALYELRAEIHFLHASVLKKRQIASSYFHCAKLINKFWFEAGAILKIGGSLKAYIDDQGSWKFLNEYRDFLNEHTAWYRPNEPNKVLNWQQRIEVVINGRKTMRGLKSKLTGASFEKDPTSGVGGPCDIFFHEEAGIAPKMLDTMEFMLPAMRSGMMTTGIFIAAGSVGKLEHCEPLKKITLDPETNWVLPVDTNLLDEYGTTGRTGLFIPEQWSMLPFIDEYGNSLVEEALEAIKKERVDWKRQLTPDQYQLRISQKPTNIEEAFAARKSSKFPVHLVTSQLRRIEAGDYPVRYVDLLRNDKGVIEIIPSKRAPITEFPVTKKTEDKRGVICMYEEPIKGAPWGTYYASIDPVGEGRTTTSESLCSIFVWKNDIEVIKDEGNGQITNFVEPGKIVLAWCGRYDDLKETHEQLEKIIELYNAWTVIEANVSLFIQYMISKRKQKFLVMKDQLLFLKDLSNQMSFQDYGWKNTGIFFKTHLLSYGVQFLEEAIDVKFDEGGTVKETRYGVERIPDPMLLREMLAYQDKINVDRLVAFCAMVAFIAVQQANRGIQKRVERTNDKLENPSKMSKLLMRPFVNLGGGKMKRSGFKNLR